jgi:hypothetical protein
VAARLVWPRIIQLWRMRVSQQSAVVLWTWRWGTRWSGRRPMGREDVGDGPGTGAGHVALGDARTLVRAPGPAHGLISRSAADGTSIAGRRSLTSPRTALATTTSANSRSAGLRSSSKVSLGQNIERPQGIGSQLVAPRFLSNPPLQQTNAHPSARRRTNTATPRAAPAAPRGRGTLEGDPAFAAERQIV